MLLLGSDWSATPALELDFNSTLAAQHWLLNSRLGLNQKKSCSMIFGLQHTHSYHVHLPIHFVDGSSLYMVDLFKYLGPCVDPELSSNPILTRSLYEHTAFLKLLFIM